jgi:pantothenate kinase
VTTSSIGDRRVIGIVGAPGSGKSTLAARFAAERPDTHVVVPMDGFHLAQGQLDRLGLSHRKGAPDTFDVGGYVALLERIRQPSGDTVYAPLFDRHLEEPIANALAIEQHHTTVITEGNYLLHTEGGWQRVRALLDECWYIECDEQTRIARLVTRHIEHGRTAAQADAWVHEVDEPNAQLIRTTKPHADRIIQSDALFWSGFGSPDPAEP